jgi:hypothetical protein
MRFRADRSATVSGGYLFRSARTGTGQLLDVGITTDAGVKLASTGSMGVETPLWTPSLTPFTFTTTVDLVRGTLYNFAVMWISGGTSISFLAANVFDTSLQSYWFSNSAPTDIEKAKGYIGRSITYTAPPSVLPSDFTSGISAGNVQTKLPPVALLTVV